jgi:hypothetical protein
MSDPHNVIEGLIWDLYWIAQQTSKRVLRRLSGTSADHAQTSRTRKENHRGLYEVGLNLAHQSLNSVWRGYTSGF